MNSVICKLELPVTLYFTHGRGNPFDTFSTLAGDRDTKEIDRIGALTNSVIEELPAIT